MKKQRRINFTEGTVKQLNGESIFDTYVAVQEEYLELSKLNGFQNFDSVAFPFPFEVHETTISRTGDTEQITRTVRLKDAWIFVGVHGLPIPGKTINAEEIAKFYNEYWPEQKLHQRLGQAFCNYFLIGPFPKLFYTQDVERAKAIIAQYAEVYCQV